MLAGVAVRTGRMPHQDPTPADIYVALLDYLHRTGRIGEVRDLPLCRQPSRPRSEPRSRWPAQAGGSA